MSRNQAAYPALRRKTQGSDDLVRGSVPRSTQGEHLQGSTVERQCAGLGDAFGAPFQDEDFYFCQRQLTRKPQSHRSAANYDDVKLIAHDHLTIYLTMLDII